MDTLQEQLGKTVGYFGVDLEARDTILPHQETNFANWAADLVRTEYRCNFAIVNSGSFRKNGVFPTGPFSLMGI